jgi:Domain of unknown function (DUF4328)
MSTVQQPPEPEQNQVLPPGSDPTRQVMPPLPPRPPASARPAYQPIGGRAAATTAVLALLLVLDVAAVVSGYFEVRLFDRIAAGENVAPSEADANDTRQGMIALGQTALWVACAGLFIAWLYRAYSNMDALAPPHRRYEKGWAIGAWFIPILNLWRPKQIVNDVWDSGQPRKDPPWWLMVWWIIGFLISGILGRIAFPELSEDASLQELRTDTINYMVSDGFDVAVLALAIVVVRTLTKRQEAKAGAAPPA